MNNSFPDQFNKQTILLVDDDPSLSLKIMETELSEVVIFSP